MRVNPKKMHIQDAESDLIDEKIAIRLRDEALLRASHQHLEKRVADSTRDLAESNIRLLREITERREAEEELRRAYDRNELLLESAGEGIYGVDTTGRCTFANRATTNMLGFTREELLGAEVRPVGSGAICRKACRKGSTPKLFRAEPKNIGESSPVSTRSVS